MEPEGSVPCLQEPSTGSYPELEQPIPYYPILSLRKIQLNVIHPPVLVFLVDYFLLAFQPISYMYISLIFAV
jgi:hypothetical protein